MSYLVSYKSKTRHERGSVYAPYIPRINRIWLRSARIQARTRKLSARWTVELKQDLMALHSMDAEDAIIDAVNNYQDQEQDMRQIKVNKERLLAIIKKNREDHRGMFLEAQTKFREIAIKALDHQLKAARTGKRFVLQELIELRAPEDHTKDYDRTIQMLEMSVEEEIVISDQEFQHFVQDVWEWSRNWALSNSGYVNKNSRYYGKICSLASNDSD